MKKKILLMITILILLSGCATKQDDESIFIHKEMKYLDNWQMDPNDYETFKIFKSELFIYGQFDDVMGNKLFDKRIGPADYQEGYLYLKNYEENKVYQLTNQPVETFYTEFNRDLHLFAYNNEVYRLSDDFMKCESIYEGSGKINFNVYDTQIDKNYLYFVDGDKLVKLSLSDYSYQVLTEKCYGESFIVKKDIAVLCYIYDKNQEGCIYYIINIKEGYRRAILNDFEERLFDIDEDFFGQETEYTYQKYVEPDMGGRPR
ncbi:MAG: hypothetical protein ACI4WG_03670 [Erysipelotrichaceae bacterium]